MTTCSGREKDIGNEEGTDNRPLQTAQAQEIARLTGVLKATLRWSGQEIVRLSGELALMQQSLDLLETERNELRLQLQSAKADFEAAEAALEAELG